MRWKACILVFWCGAALAAEVQPRLNSDVKYWGYRSIAPANVPSVAHPDWVHNEIDRFVLAQLEFKGIAPVGDAPPDALVRRLYFDLTGLPPTPQQIDEYLNDPSPERYERLVDRLLASDEFGRRWGRHWLDVARFGESLTLRGFILHNAWRYRDYVIDSFNRDRPFNQFVREQIAGDLLPPEDIDDRRRKLIATAFLAIGNNNLEEQDKKQLEMDVVDEQIGAISTAFLAQTIGCARCHDHKFDPISTRDYYALAGILHSTQALEHANVSKWLEIPLPMDGPLEAKVEKHEAEIAAMQEKINAARAVALRANGGKNLAVSDVPGIVLDDVDAKKVGVWKESKSVQPYIGAGYLTDNGDKSETKTLTFQPDIPETAKYDVRLAYTASSNRASNVAVTVFSADGEKQLTVDERVSPPLDGHFVSLGQYTFEKSDQGYILISNAGADGHVTVDALQLLPTAGTFVPPTPTSTTTSDLAAKAPNLKKMEAELKKLVEAGPARETVISVRESKEIADSHVNIRGSIHSLGDLVPRGFPKVIAISDAESIPPSQSGRLQLADWLADPQNPLPARVMANRTWYWLMGSGIVRTTDNFGTTGELPSNPQLLDYLAERFVAGGWSVKSLIRRIVLSHTYQLSTADDAKAMGIDPENRLQWRMNRRRLDAECIRDAILADSGQLDPAGGGSLYKESLNSDFAFKQTSMRRSVYLPAFRNALPDIFEAFDFADPSVSTSRRNVSTVAPQALFMLNNPFVIDQASHAADRILADKVLSDDKARVDFAYRLTLGRQPSASEENLAINCIANSTDPHEAWSQLMHALFASMDFRYEN